MEVLEILEDIQALEVVMEDEVTEEVLEIRDFLAEVVVIEVMASEDLVEWLDPDLSLEEPHLVEHLLVQALLKMVLENKQTNF